MAKKKISIAGRVSKKTLPSKSKFVDNCSASTNVQILNHMRAKIQEKRLGSDKSYKGMWKYHPVGFIEFCRDWIKEPLFDGPQEDFSDDVMGIPGELGPWQEEIKGILLAWGKGSGKGSLSAKLITYVGYLLKCMHDPRTFFKIGVTAPIHMINVSYNSQQAKLVFFDGYLKPTVLNTINPATGRNFFKEQGMDMRVGEGDIQSNVIHFEKPINEKEGGITAASLAGDRGTAEGFSPLMIFVDEISAMQSPVKAETLVEDLENSAKSRFPHHYKLIIASFKKGRNCLMSMKVAAAEKDPHPSVYLSKKATWEVNKFKKEEDFQDMFEKNPVKSARTFKFQEVGGIDEAVFFKVPELLDEAFGDTSRNPFIGDVIKCRSDQLKILEFKDWFKPSIGLNYHIHVDLAKGTATDRAGIVMSHKEGLGSLSEAELHKYLDGEIDRDFNVVGDIILQINPDEQKKQIILDDVRKFIIKLHSKGFKVKVTLDGYQSLDFIQQLNDIGIDAELLSVDRDRKAYDSIQSVIYRKNLILYKHPILRRELAELEESDDGKKIDHPYKSIHRALHEDGIEAGCFSGDTKVKLLDGSNPTLKELADNYDGKPIYIYTVRNGKIDVGVARNPRLTKRNTETVVVKIDSCEEIKCTPDHRFMLRDGSYKEARDLSSGDSLMPLYTRISSRKLCNNVYKKKDMVGYELYKNIHNKGWSYTHRMVGKWMNPKYTGNQHVNLLVHHDKGKLNNSPDVLMVITREEHYKIHKNDILEKRKTPEFEKKRRDGVDRYNAGNKENQSKLMKSLHERPEFRDALIKRTSELGKITGPINLIKHNKSESHRQKASERGKVTIWKAIEGSKKIRGRDRYWTFRFDLTIEKIKDAIVDGHNSISKLKKHFKCGSGTLNRVLKENNYSSILDVKEDVFINHKVTSVITGDRRDVYDLTVEETENFALSAGIFVHNSKDIADSLAGSVLRSVLSESPNIPLMPQMKKATHHADEIMDERDLFERQVTGGLIEVNSQGSPQKKPDGWVPLMPSKG